MRNGKYLLNSGQANYSFGTLHTVFQRAFSKTNLKTFHPKSVLILGFGAGSIAHILQVELKLNCAITGIEKDAKLIEIAKKYFRFSEHKNLQVCIDDALTYMEGNTKKYDLIVVDLFDEMDVPEQFQTPKFIQLLFNHLNKSGWMYYNYVVDTALQQQKFTDFEAQFNEIFETSTCLNFEQGNKILFCKPTSVSLQ